MQRTPNQSPGSVSSTGADFTVTPASTSGPMQPTDIVDRQPDVPRAGTLHRERDAVLGSDVLEQFQHLPAADVEVGAQQPGARRRR